MRGSIRAMENSGNDKRPGNSHGDESESGDARASDSQERENVASSQQGGSAPVGRASTSWLAEALSITAIVFAVAAVVGTRLVETFAVVNGSAAGQLAVYARLIIGDGVTALLGTVFSVLALVSAVPGSRSWARPLAAAALLTSAIAIVFSVVSIFLMPAQQAQPGFG